MRRYMWMLGGIVIVVSLFTLLFHSYEMDRLETYTDAELRQMSAEDLYKLFLENGLEVGEELKKVFSDEEMAIMFKENFELFSKGIINRSHIGYKRMAESAKLIYEKILK